MLPPDVPPRTSCRYLDISASTSHSLQFLCIPIPSFKNSTPFLFLEILKETSSSMRLLRLDEDGAFSLVEHSNEDVPPYAILSHTWGKDCDEIKLRDITEGTGNNKTGYRKLVFCQKQAAKDGLHFFWVDTCCINKESSAELSEAINSMFLWYRKAAKCYVYLTDVSATDPETSQSFETSRWFTRGWTLQELLAPASVEFFSAEGHLIGDKISLVQRISNITGIPPEALNGKDLLEFGISERMEWAKERETKREEDAAYSLLGIFGVHMHHIYGEGRENAFRRLQKEIRELSDQSRIQKETLNKICRWLSAPDPSTNYNKAQKQRQPATGLWLLESESFKRWKTNSASWLWLYGIPGCGKTILSSTILQELLKHCQGNPSAVTLYFYFDFNDAQKQDPELMLRTLITQLPRPSTNGFEHLSALFSSCGEGQRQPLLLELMTVIEHMIQDFSQVYIVLDALDECTQRSELMNVLEIMASWKLQNSHVLMTSRRERDITSSLDRYIDAKDTVCLQSDVVDNDIQQYVRHRLSDDKSLAKWEKDAAIRQEIETVIMKGACGM
jgi:hypothetical protein